MGSIFEFMIKGEQTMKHLKPILILVFVWILAPRAAANDIGYVEKFCLMPDREEALKLLIPGTQDYYFYHALDAQLRGDKAEVQKLLGLWIKRYGRTSRVQEIQNREALLNYKANPNATLAHVRRELGLQYNHSRIVERQKPKHPTALDPKLINFEAFRARAFTSGDLSGVEDRGLELLDHAGLGATRLRHLLSRLKRPDLANLPQLIIKDLRNEHSRGFGSHGIHRNLTIAQMDELLQIDPKLIDNSNFINAYLTKLAPSADVDTRFDLAERGKHLNRHADHPVDKWRNLFAAVRSQLDEIEGKKPVLVDKDDRNQKQDQLAGTQASYEFKVEDRQVQLSFQNLKEVTVNYYPMDVELLFSRKPFMKEDTDHFTYLVPNTSDTVKLPVKKTAHTFAIPERFHSSNVMVEIVANGIRKS